MFIYSHWVIMANSDKLSDITVLEKYEVYSTKKANIAFAFSLNLKSKKGHNSVRSLRMTSKFELGLYFIMLYNSVKLE